VLLNSLRAYELDQKELDERKPWTSILADAAWAIRSTYHTVLDATPGQIVFGRDMVLPIQFKADWARILRRRQDAVTVNNKRENATRIAHQYKVGDKVLLAKPGIIPKLEHPRTGPYEITQVYTNGTVRIRRGILFERVNLRRLTPYYERHNSGSECSTPMVEARPLSECSTPMVEARPPPRSQTRTAVDKTPRQADAKKARTKRARSPDGRMTDG